MAEHTLITSSNADHAAGGATSRRGALALLTGAAASVGLTAGAAATVADAALPGAHPDAEMLALRPRFEAVLADANASEMATLPPNASRAAHEKLEGWITAAGEELQEVCRAIVAMAPAQTQEGRALKAAAAMHQLRDAYSHGAWPGDGEELAWDVLSEIAGAAHVAPMLPEPLRAGCEPERTAV